MVEGIWYSIGLKGFLYYLVSIEMDVKVCISAAFIIMVGAFTLEKEYEYNK